jgi:hypothetical protein
VLAVPGDGADDDPVGEVVGRLPDRAPGEEAVGTDLDLQHLGPVTLDDGDVLGAARAGEPDDLLGGRLPGTHRHVDADGLEDVGEVAGVDDRDGPLGTDPLRQQRREQVLLVVLQRGDEHVGLVDVLPFEELLVGRVAVHHRRLREVLGQPAGPVLVEFDQPRGEPPLFEQGSRLEADLPAADDDDVVRSVLFGRYRGAELARALRTADDDDVVARFYRRVPARDDDRFVAHDGDERQRLEAVGLPDRLVRDRALGRNLEFGHLDEAVREHVHVLCSR